MTPEQAKNTLINSDYPTDEVIYRTSGSGVIGNYTSGNLTITINHGLPFRPLPVVVWSTVADFSITYTSDSGPLPDRPFSNNIGLVLGTVTDSNTIKLNFVNFMSTGFTLYYRIFAFMPSNIDVDIAPTSSIGNNFIFNTDYRYSKLFIDARVQSVGDVAVFDHNLGYIPQALVWSEYNDGTIETPGVTFNSDSSQLPLGWAAGYTMTTTQLRVNMAMSSYPYAHARIYLDD